MAETNWTAGKGTTALGIIGTALGGLATAGGGLGMLTAAGRAAAGNPEVVPVCSESMPVNRYEAAQAARIAELETEVKLRDANTYTDGKILETYQYIDGRLRAVEGQIAAQAVKNQETADAFQLVRNDIVCVKNELYSAISRERDERCCADNAIVNYVNATFYPKQVADVETGTGTTPQSIYNPIPNCGKCCG